MAFDLNRLKHLVKQHKTVARVVITNVRGSTPRSVGTEMFVWSEDQDGTIGGGALEFEVTNAARASLTTTPIWTRTYPLGPNLGQCCGGSVSVLCEVFDATNLPNAHAQMVSRSSPKSLNIPKHTEITVTNSEICEPLRKHGTPIWVWGAGHVGRALVNFCYTLPQFEVTWIDFDQARFPKHTDPSINVMTVADLPRLVPHAPESAHHFIVTHSHDIDLALCHALLKHSFGYAGLIGSATKWSRFRKKLTDPNITAEDMDRITCPIGRPEFGKHPSEIAIGVLCDLLSGKWAQPKGAEQRRD